MPEARHSARVLPLRGSSVGYPANARLENLHLARALSRSGNMNYVDRARWHDMLRMNNNLRASIASVLAHGKLVRTRLLRDGMDTHSFAPFGCSPKLT
jgi:hypothetical protein